jgi:uncharacterized phage-associated protein
MINNHNKKIISADLIADYFIWTANNKKKPITNKKLQKLLYYAQAWYLVFYGKPLFKDKIEAWIHGPAIKSIYRKYKPFGFGPIKKEIKDQEIKQIDLKAKKLLQEVWEVYGKYDGDYLEILTHNESPWQNAREKLDICQASDTVISVDSMKAFYTEKLEKSKSLKHGSRK